MSTVIRERSSLSVIASAIYRIQHSHAEAAFYDAGFDGGEFSGPAHASMEERQIRAALAEHGWTVAEYERELASRTSDRWVFFHGMTLPFFDEEPEPEPTADQVRDRLMRSIFGDAEWEYRRHQEFLDAAAWDDVAAGEAFDRWARIAFDEPAAL